MKKTIFAVLAVLLVLMLATCDIFEQPLATGGDLVTEDGRPMASLTINFEGLGTSRALVAANAPGDADFYEVVFKDPNVADNYHVKNFVTSDSATNRTITIPVGDYTGDTKAVLFAGKDDGTYKILLGIGYITRVCL